MSPRGNLKAEFPYDVSWLDGSQKTLLKEAVECIKEDVMTRHWWHDIKGQNNEEIVGANF